MFPRSVQDLAQKAKAGKLKVACTSGSSSSSSCLGRLGGIASLGRALWSVVTVCAVALQAQVIETPIETPTCVERGKPGDPSVAGEGSISSVWSTSDQREGGKKEDQKRKRKER